MKERTEDFVECPLRDYLTRIRKSEFGRHMRNARKELLLAMKSVIEAGIERLEERGEDAEDCAARKVEIN